MSNIFAVFNSKKSCRCGLCGRRRYLCDVRQDSNSPNGLMCVVCDENKLFGLDGDVYDHD